MESMWETSSEMSYWHLEIILKLSENWLKVHVMNICIYHKTLTRYRECYTCEQLVIATVWYPFPLFIYFYTHGEQHLNGVIFLSDCHRSYRLHKVGIICGMQWLNSTHIVINLVKYVQNVGRAHLQCVCKLWITLNEMCCYRLHNYSYIYTLSVFQTNGRSLVPFYACARHLQHR